MTRHENCTMDKQKQLEKLLLSEDLERLNNLTRHFNIFNALKIQDNELRHSNFLAWLMTPYETHELGDYFLKEFLKSAIKNYSSNDNVLSLKDIAFSSFNDAEIARESQHIDLLITSRKNKFVCVIENKIWSDEHDEQLERYTDIVNNTFKDYDKKLYIFLAPDPETELLERNLNSGDKVYYIPMSYEQVYGVIKKVLDFKGDAINPEVKVFIEHYKNMVERDIMGNQDKEIVELSRKIYRDNRAAIDFINKNCNYCNCKTDVLGKMYDIIKSDDDFSVIDCSSTTIQCVPSKLKNPKQFQYGNGELPNDFIVAVRFISFAYEHKDAYVEIAISQVKNQSDSEKRKQLLSFIAEKTELKFNKPESVWRYTIADSIITYEKWLEYCDNEELLKEHIKGKIKDLKPIYIDKLREALNEFEYKPVES